ncbi:AraC family transcriptional regulator [Vibrio viridaestus]|uniref:AraC family transcriptional regulator n=2 Tax=Vibrio viridaestus TaxID=2487322 RepID=A0A3N9TFL5_9VIBR|nr:AraC family transcriptional regulator [Vibrio viridaestus]
MFKKYLATTFGDPINDLSRNSKDAIEAYFCLVDFEQGAQQLSPSGTKIGLVRLQSDYIDARTQKTLFEYRNQGYFLLCLNNNSSALCSLYPGVWSLNFQASTSTPFRLMSAVVREIDAMNIPSMSLTSQYIKGIGKTPLTPNSILSLLYTIETQIEHELREDQIAEKYGYSVAYFSRTFHHLLGISFRDYLCRKRIALAKRLLIEQPNTKIAIVALQCGYKDLSYFNRIFKKKVGTSPGEYKKLALTS